MFLSYGSFLGGKREVVGYTGLSEVGGLAAMR